ncbi:MAG: hypothetical protein E4H40_05570 [Candidatus Brocadiia bacterium]|nr:MAG: hypothetical protein E4H40_05570 [Candidatus Brocadiia bacterium]
MGSLFRYVYVAFVITTVLIYTVYLRGSINRMTYRLSVRMTEENRLKQDLRQKQLRLESMINPVAISERMKAE